MGWGAVKSEATSLQLVLRVVRELRGGLELLGRVGSVPKSVEKERGASSDVIAPRIGFHQCPYSHDLEVA